MYNHYSGDTTEVSPGVHCQWALSLPVWSPHYQRAGLEGEHSGQCGHVHVRTCKVHVCCMKCWTIMHVHTHIVMQPKIRNTCTYMYSVCYITRHIVGSH